MSVLKETMPVGTVVRLRSGSPAMTVVASLEASPYVETYWFHDGELRRGTFLPETLITGPQRNDRNDNAR